MNTTGGDALTYYNEFDPGTAAWLNQLQIAEQIPHGRIDIRSIRDVKPDDLAGRVQCHFFAGIGGWPYALRLAGWPDDLPVWTGSCPCQPFSSAGKQLGESDERHLWPEFLRLISECRPSVVFGEQVASRLGREWLSGVRADLEALGYAVGAADLCAAGVGAPHIRQRLYWVAYASGTGWRALLRAGAENRRAEVESDGLGNFGAVAYADGGESDGRSQRRPKSVGRCAVGGCGAFGLGHADDKGPQRRRELRDGSDQRSAWSSSVVLLCTDGKARRIEPGSFPLAPGIPGRVGLLRGYGNAIVPQVAAEFVRAYMSL